MIILDRLLETLVDLDYGEWVENISMPNAKPSSYIRRPIPLSARELVTIIRASLEMQ